MDARLVLAVSALRRSTAESRTATAAGERFIEIMPRIALALVTAGFLSVLVPGEPVARYIGPDSGFPGLVASVVGGFVPGGPILSFPLVVVLYKAGQGCRSSSRS